MGTAATNGLKCFRIKHFFEVILTGNFFSTSQAVFVWASAESQLWSGLSPWNWNFQQKLLHQAYLAIFKHGALGNPHPKVEVQRAGKIPLLYIRACIDTCRMVMNSTKPWRSLKIPPRTPAGWPFGGHPRSRSQRGSFGAAKHHRILRVPWRLRSPEIGQTYMTYVWYTWYDWRCLDVIIWMCISTFDILMCQCLCIYTHTHTHTHTLSLSLSYCICQELLFGESPIKNVLISLRNTLPIRLSFQQKAPTFAELLQRTVAAALHCWWLGTTLWLWLT